MNKKTRIKFSVSLSDETEDSNLVGITKVRRFSAEQTMPSDKADIPQERRMVLDGLIDEIERKVEHELSHRNRGATR